MKKSETIDILIPAYNAEEYLKQCLTSLLKQTYKNFQIKIVDDGSTDRTSEIIKEFQKKNKNIIMFKKENECNISKTRNFLLSKITSKYFAFIDVDDFVEPTYLEELYSNITTYNADISCVNKVRHNINKKINLNNNDINSIIVMNSEEAIAEMLSSKMYNGTCTAKMMKTSLIKDSLFDEKIHYGEDLDFCFKLMQKSQRITFSTKKLYHYIIRKNSIVTSKFNEKKLTCIDCYDNIIKKIKDDSNLTICAKSMQGLIAIELLYYTWRDKFKNKEIKTKLKNIIKNSIPFIKKNKRLSKLYQLTPMVWRLTKLM